MARCALDMGGLPNLLTNDKTLFTLSRWNTITPAAATHHEAVYGPAGLVHLTDALLAEMENEGLPLNPGHKDPMHSEHRLLNYIAFKILSYPDVKGIIFLHVELDNCKACQETIQAFRTMFPNILLITQFSFDYTFNYDLGIFDGNLHKAQFFINGEFNPNLEFIFSYLGGSQP